MQILFCCILCIFRCFFSFICVFFQPEAQHLHNDICRWLYCMGTVDVVPFGSYLMYLHSFTSCFHLNQKYPLPTHNFSTN